MASTRRPTWRLPGETPVRERRNVCIQRGVSLTGAAHHPSGASATMVREKTRTGCPPAWWTPRLALGDVTIAVSDRVSHVKAPGDQQTPRALVGWGTVCGQSSIGMTLLFSECRIAPNR
jgi:hypothetical protein